MNKSLTAKKRKRDAAKHSGQDPSIIKELEDDIENIQANIDYVQESITEAQNSIMQIEESKVSPSLKRFLPKKCFRPSP